jgi:coenzyme F420-reducing hydrogenase delta subunit
MNDSSLQLTIRGVDLHTKRQLTKIASRKGVSLNNLVVGALQQAAGTNTTEQRLQLIRETLRQHRISSNDIATAETAIAEMDAISKAKQKSDEHDLSF